MDWYSSLARLESQPFLKRVKGKTYQTILVKDHSRCLKCCFVLYFLLLYDNLKIVTSLVKTEEKLSSRKSSCQLISLLWPGIMTENLEWLHCLCCCWCRLFIYQGIERQSWEKDECVIMIAYLIFTDSFLSIILCFHLRSRLLNLCFKWGTVQSMVALTACCSLGVLAMENPSLPSTAASPLMVIPWVHTMFNIWTRNN